MADPWPVTLPRNFIAGYTDGFPDTTISTDPDIGPPITRRRSTAGVRPLSGSMRMTRAQLATLKTFFEVTIEGGALPFTFPDPSFGGDVLVKFDKGRMPSWVQVTAEIFRVNISLLVLPS